MDPMRTFVLLSSAACLSTIAEAQAADLPIKAKAVEYVRVCSLYGAGFWYIPGTDTCIDIGGYLRVDTTFNGGGAHGQPAWSGDSGQDNRYFDWFQSRSRMALQVDTRTATEYGVVRTYGQADIQFNNFGTANPAVSPFVISGPPSGLSSSAFSGVGGGITVPEYLFIQFAGFTFGKSASAYATPWQGFPSNITSFLLGGQNTDIGVSNIQYTYDFGNGLTGSIGLDDPEVQDRTSLYNLGVGLNAVGTGSFSYGGTHAPDVVARIRVDQAWGLFQVSGAAHLVNASYNDLSSGAAPNNLSEISGHPNDKWGGALMAALQIKNLPTGTGDDFKIDGSYAKGLTKDVIATSSSSPSFAMFGGSGRAYQSIGFGATTDAIFLPVADGGTGDLKLTEAWGTRGAFTHNWDPHWSSAIFGSASWVHYNGSSTDLTTAKGQYCFQYVTSNKLGPGTTSADFSCNPDFAVFQIGFNTRWTPVKNLTFTAEVQYFRLDQNFTGTAVLTPSAPKPTATYEYRDQDTVLLQVRAQRNF